MTKCSDCDQLRGESATAFKLSAAYDTAGDPNRTFGNTRDDSFSARGLVSFNELGHRAATINSRYLCMGMSQVCRIPERGRCRCLLTYSKLNELDDLFL